MAMEMDTLFVSEYGRTLCEKQNNNLTYDDLLRIAKTHVANEELSAGLANVYLFVDTSPLTTLFYSLHLFGLVDPELQWLSQRQYDLIFLCAPDFPFVQDGSREGGHLREHQHQWYVTQLDECRVAYLLLEGDIETRVQKVKHILATTVKNRKAPST